VIEDGAIDLDLGLDVHYYDYGGIFPKFSSNMKVRSAPISILSSVWKSNNHCAGHRHYTAILGGMHQKAGD
jgi:hypothetical protein